MTKLSIVSRDEVSENQVIRSCVAKTQQPDAERLKEIFVIIWDPIFALASKILPDIEFGARKFSR